MKTDPENADYTVEKGASRNYEPWREKDRDKAEAVAAREEEERGNAMKVSHPAWLCAHNGQCTCGHASCGGSSAARLLRCLLTPQEAKQSMSQLNKAHMQACLRKRPM